MGEPNVGKSTLLNRILKQKISIVSSKPQTTRHRILGILTEETHQIIFLDTPGIIKPRYLLQEAMMQFAGRAIADADVLLFMIDALDPKTGSDLAHAEAFRRLQELRKPVILVINKIDLVEKSMLLPVIEFYSHAFPFREIFPISALTGEGIGDLLGTLNGLLYETFVELSMHLPYQQGQLISLFHEQGQVDRLEHKPGGVEIQGRIPGRLVSYYRKYQKDGQ